MARDMSDEHAEDDESGPCRGASSRLDVHRRCFLLHCTTTTDENAARTL